MFRRDSYGKCSIEVQSDHSEYVPPMISSTVHSENIATDCVVVRNIWIVSIQQVGIDHHSVKEMKDALLDNK